MTPYHDQRDDSDCFRCVLANYLGLPYDDVPDFYGDQIRANGTPNAAWHNVQAWLASRGLVAIEGPADQNMQPIPAGTIALMTGRNPRNRYWDHTVLGEWTGETWRVLHDPHASRAGLAGGPHTLTFIALGKPIE